MRIMADADLERILDTEWLAMPKELIVCQRMPIIDFTLLLSRKLSDIYKVMVEGDTVLEKYRNDGFSLLFGIPDGFRKYDFLPGGFTENSLRMRRVFLDNRLKPRKSESSNMISGKSYFVYMNGLLYLCNKHTGIEELDNDIEADGLKMGHLKLGLLGDLCSVRFRGFNRGLNGVLSDFGEVWADLEFNEEEAVFRVYALSEPKKRENGIMDQIQYQFSLIKYHFCRMFDRYMK